MLSYQVRPRVFRIEGGTSLPFPSKGEARFHLGPRQPFGMEAGGGRTGIRAVTASVLFNANTGAHTVQSKEPLQPLDVTLLEPTRTVRLDGNVLSISQEFTSNRHLTELVEGVYYAIPMLLAVEFEDPPVIERVEGVVGSVSFRWELQEWRCECRFTTQQEQEQAVASSWEKIGLVSGLANRRLLAALHYFHVAVRLSRQSTTVGEFMAETILNYSKVLEVLFPPGGGGRTRDAARRGLKCLEFSDTEIEADYIPAMVLRNEIDVGHVDLALFKPDQLAVIHGYVSRTETNFRTLLRRVLFRVESGQFEVEPYVPTSVRGEAAVVLERMRQYADRHAL